MNHIIDICKIPALFAVAVDGGLLSGQHFAAENSQNAGVMRSRILVGTKDVEVAQRHRLQPVDAREGAQIVLAGQLGHGIRADGSGKHCLVLG